MNERRLRDELLRTLPPAAEQAQERARAVTLAAHDGARCSPRRHRLRATLPVVVGLLLALVGGAAAATPAGSTVTDWVRDLVGRSTAAPPPAPALSRLPAEGRLLVTGPAGAWIVHADGGRRRLGPYANATWSPRGLFVGATRGRQLVALDPRGGVRWALARPDAVHDARWAPSGFRVAYRAGSNLRVVAGDGSADRLVATGVRPVAPAWRPAGTRNELAYVDRGGQVVLVDVDGGRALARLRPGVAPRLLQWSLAGTRLLVISRRSARLLSPTGSVSRVITAPAGSEFADAALSPDGKHLVLLRRSTRTPSYEVLVATVASDSMRGLFSAAGSIRSVTWSPDGRLVLADWAGADQWLFLPVTPEARASAVAGIAAQFDLGRANPRHGMNVEGWCCEP